jgi:hypothetical protein
MPLMPHANDQPQTGRFHAQKWPFGKPTCSLLNRYTQLDGDVVHLDPLNLDGQSAFLSALRVKGEILVVAIRLWSSRYSCWSIRMLSRLGNLFVVSSFASGSISGSVMTLPLLKCDSRTRRPALRPGILAGTGGPHPAPCLQA